MEQGYITRMQLVVSMPEKAVKYILPNDLESVHRRGNDGEIRCTETDNPDDITSAKSDHMDATALPGPSDLDTIMKSIDAILARNPIQTAPLNDLAVRLLSAFEHASDIKYLNKAISGIQEAVRRIDQWDKPVEPKLLNNLASALFIRYETPIEEYDPKMVVMSKEEYSRAENAKKNEDFEAAIANVVKAIEVNSGCFVDEAVQRGNISRMRLRQYLRERNENHLKAAISNARKASSVVPSRSPYRSFLLANLGDALQHKYLNTNDAGALIEAIDLTMQAIHLGYEFEPRERGFDSTDVTEGAKEGISPGRKLLLPYFRGHHPELAVRLDRLGWLIEDRYRLTRNPLDLDASIWISREASVLIPRDHLYFNRIKICPFRIDNPVFKPSNFDKFTKAVSKARDKVDEALKPSLPTPYTQKHLDLIIAMICARDALGKKYEMSCDLSDLTEAISAQRNHVRISIDICPSLQEFLIPQKSTTQKSILHRLWRKIYPEERKYPDQDHGSDLARHLSALSKLLRKRYEVNRDKEDLDDAISASRQAICVFAYRTDIIFSVRMEVEQWVAMLRMRYLDFGQEEDREMVLKLIPEIMNFRPNLDPHIMQRQRIMLL